MNLLLQAVEMDVNRRQMPKNNKILGCQVSQISDLTVIKISRRQMPKNNKILRCQVSQT